ncbi:hypothetical protein F4859DRAFT_97563 [Xylaria cf. heliscus]|nr:hypothetical protein F4859DRAFT_97563 [Xylaria cf. heliscus]
MTTIPTPRDILTSLISSLSSIPLADPATTTTGAISSHRSSNPHAGASPPTNPFKLIPPAYRSILTTLHVLYPSTVLPALDLLDRRLVTRVILNRDAAQHPTSVQDATITSAQESPAEGEIPNLQEDNKPPPLPLYHLVRSVQPQSQRRQKSTSSSGGRVYTVRLESWNCTCAAFAFSAFPPLPSPTFSSTSEHGYQIHPAADTHGDDDAMSSSDREDTDWTWEFGGLSADGKGGAGGVPCCKHLLACVLAERWGSVLGGYMEERVVGREEGAGLVGDL